jgi:hypothetical protein
LGTEPHPATFIAPISHHYGIVPSLFLLLSGQLAVTYHDGVDIASRWFPGDTGE